MSRIRSIAPAIGMTLVLAACTAQTPTPAPSAAPTTAPTVAPSTAVASEPPASVEPTAESTPGTKFAGVNVNILTFNGPQVA